MRLGLSLLILFFSFSLSAQKMPTTQYDPWWEKIDSLVQQAGLYQSALEEVQQLYTKAKAEKQSGHQIKAILYRIQLQEVLVEESDTAALNLLRKEIALEQGVARALLNTLLGDYYKKKYDQQRWSIYDRTPLAETNVEDIQTWTATDFHKAITKAYREALSEPTLKGPEARRLVEPLIKKGENSNYRSSLYELVVKKALNYFKENPVELTEQADQSFWENKTLWQPAEGFMKLRLSEGDSAEPGRISLVLLQDLMKYYETRQQREELAATDLERYLYLHYKAEFADKDSLYKAVLEQHRKEFKGTAAADQAVFLLADWYYRNEENPVKALGLAEELVRENKTSPGSIRTYNLVQEIKSPRLSLQTERVNIPGEPFRGLVEWKNLDRIYLRIIQVDPVKHGYLLEQSSYFDSTNWALLTGSESMRAWEQALPESNNYKLHRAEIKVDALPVGRYFLLASDRPSFSMADANLGVVELNVSNISFIHSGSDYFFLHRNTGQPLPKATVELYQRIYDPVSRSYRRVKKETLTANDKGYLYIDQIGDTKYGSFSLVVQHGIDSLRIDEQEYVYSYHQREAETTDEAFEKRNARVHWFLDRGIYRPGQLLYFKAVLTSKDKETGLPRLLTGKKTTLQLFDANGEKVDSLLLSSNEYGSVAGKFTLPSTGLTGQFYLAVEEFGNETYFNVEEYKRPRFEVSLDKLKTTVRLGDTVTIKGNAMAYAGNAISNATGTYRVTRGARFPYPWKLAAYGFRPGYRTAEIAHGSLTTAADGSFSISFPAITDGNIDPKTDPVFDYTIHIDITDLNGETRSASSSVPVSYKSLQLTVRAEQQKMPTTDFTRILVSSTNLVGEPQPTKVNVEIVPLKSPGKLLRSRYWEAPDTFVLTEQEFRRYFPNDLYKNEDDPETWSEGKKVWSKSIQSDSTGYVKLDRKKWAPGWYRLIAKAVDPNGEMIESKSVVFLSDPTGKTVAETGYLSASQGKRSLKPGEKTSIELATEATNLFVIERKINWAAQSKEIKLPFSQKFRLFGLGKERVQIPVIATNADKGGIEVQHVFVKHNRVYRYDSYFSVPLEEKDLKIQLKTFRDKLEPGGKEKWTVAISGEEAEKFGMELLTSMYDASLDQFAANIWNKPAVWPSLNHMGNWTGRTNFISEESSDHIVRLEGKAEDWKKEEELLDFTFLQDRRRSFGGKLVLRESERLMDASIPAAAPVVAITKSTPAKVVADSANEDDEVGYLPLIKIPSPKNDTPPAIRTNFNETAFFFPQLSADSNGHFSFSFTMPESVTSWNWQLFAHTKSLAMGYLQQTIVTQKDLMVQPNMPRFVREGDKMEITTKVVNLTDKEVTGQAELQLIDATTNQPVDGWFRNFFPNQYFTVGPKSSELVKFPMEVPYQFDRALTWKIIARVGDKTDGESSTLPVLSNRQLVTEAIPFFINGAATKTISMTNLLNSKDSETLSNRTLTVEYSANPAWYAIQSLPYLADYPYECSEQTFNRLYGYLIADHLLKSAPRIKQVLLEWQQKDTSALLSNLQKNQELKQVLLEETPWVLEAKTEAEQKQRLLLLFDAVRLSNESSKMIAKLKEMQLGNGGFSWFTGGPDDRYITQYILTGIGHLQKLGIIDADYGLFAPIINAALGYTDQRLLEDYNKRDKGQKEPVYLNTYAVQYHYMRSFYSNKGLSGQYVVAANHYRKEMQSLWTKGNLFTKAMIALALHRTGDKQTATSILKSLQQTAIKSEDKGMYWKSNTAGYYWQEAPIETQALLIELFQELKQPAATINALKAWLLLNKQTNRWSSTKATADACYALLLQGENWLEAAPKVRVKLGEVTTITAAKEEAGTGYYQKIIPGTAVFPEMGEISIQVQQAAAPKAVAPVWGAIYWQYFDNLENITAAKGPLSISKQVMVEKLTDKGPVLEAITDGAMLKVGDKLVVRLEIKTDRQMEYVHVKDMRASALEPTNVLSGYRWKGALGYYESTRDASTNFFIQYLPKGSHVLEYSLFVSHAGTFSNGFSSIQCMYSPEFTSHTEGIKLNIEAN
ncbi:MG2 domain-containing protein [Flavihumibacter sp. RY-1]|uniref:MG2 domain-containing protein n=1 Tax=Flavihumibacter fluminis TaxID=2909236 RepID=A0ABS9BFK2_9BACT|nr:alpha-2-macroglobulin family protein [Flavihumibacter fluminis]MCF1714085.1 MG2 domain-containing protein [Flavihumibacter fluminis]